MIDLIKLQKQCCKHYGVEYCPVNLQQMVVISEGLYNVKPVEGVRYPSPQHMSGWWLTTDDYNGEVETLKTVHLEHIVGKRPDIAIYLALPFGFRFVLGCKEESVWFDEVVSKEIP